MKVKNLDHHRNGISGLGFYVGIVEDEGKEMLVIRFPKEADEETGNIVCAAFDLVELDKREIRFCYNSFRGDHFHEIMDEAIMKREEVKEKTIWTNLDKSRGGKNDKIW